MATYFHTEMLPLLLNYLPQCALLKNLHLNIPVDKQEAILASLRATQPNASLLQAIRQNGSLQHIHLFDDDSAALNSDGVVLRRLDAILDRNRRLPQVVQTLSSEDSKNLPVLFDVARHAPRTAPNMILLGLLALKPSTGDGKRKSPSS
jgi:hypothetical protein